MINAIYGLLITSATTSLVPHGGPYSFCTAAVHTADSAVVAAAMPAAVPVKSRQEKILQATTTIAKVAAPSKSRENSTANMVGKMHVVFDNDPYKWDWSKGEPPSDIYRQTTTSKPQRHDFDDFKPIENIMQNATYSERSGQFTRRCGKVLGLYFVN